MNDEQKKDIELYLSDTIIGRPYGFSVGDRHFYLYPVTLGKMYMLSRLVEQLNLSMSSIEGNPYIEAVRIVKERRELCSRILTYHTIHTKAKIFDNEFVDKRSRYFTENINDEDLATLMVMVLTADKTDLFLKYIGLDIEQSQMAKVLKVKDDANSFNFCGLSVYGALIDTACERYHWTFDYVVWEISYTNLRLMLADSPKQIYLTDDERKKVRGVTRDRNRVNGDNAKEIWAAIKSEDWQ